MNFLQIQKKVQDFIGDTTSTTLPTIKLEINETIKEIIQKGFWRFLMRTTTLTASSGINTLYFPSDFEKVVSLTERTKNLQLGRIWVGDFDRLVPDPTTNSGGPKYYMELLDDKVLAQPTTTSKVTVISDSSQDITGLTGANKATIYGVSSGVDKSEVLTLSGTNLVSSSFTYSKLYSINTNLSCFGNVRFREATVGTSLLNLYPGETERSYKKFQLYPTPDTDYTLYLVYQASQPPLINDSDTPIIPSRFHDVIAHVVVGKMLLRQGDVKAPSYVALGQAGIDRMLKDEDMLWDFDGRVRVPEATTYYSQGYPFSYH